MKIQTTLQQITRVSSGSRSQNRFTFVSNSAGKGGDILYAWHVFQGVIITQKKCNHPIVPSAGDMPPVVLIVAINNKMVSQFIILKKNLIPTENAENM